MRRWLLWNTRCRRGRRCVRVTMEAFGPALDQGLDDDELYEVRERMTGGVIIADYDCGNCGTRYRSTAIVGRTGLTETTRERV